MFSLHETQRIYLCRAAFVLLCALPTTGVLAWCVVTRLPVHRQWHERAIGHELQCAAQIGRVSTPRPELVLYDGLDLSDRETGQLLARFPAVEIETTGEGVMVRLPVPGSINGRRLADVWQRALAQVRENKDASRLRFEAGHLTVSLPSGSLTLADLAGELDCQADQSHLKLQFSRAAAGDHSSAPAEINLTRHRDTTPHTTSVELSTGGSALSCDVLAAVWPDAQSWGRACTFSGQLRASDATPGWTIELAGRLDGVDLARLLAPFPHKLTGLARLELKEVLLRDGRIERAAGSIDAGPGTLSRSLVQSALSSLRLESSPRAFAGPENRINYTQLAAGFEMSAEGLAIKGRVEGQPGAILVAADQVLAKEPTVAKQPVLNLVRTLVPQVAVQVPATRETDHLTRLLPVPPLAVPPGQETALPSARSLRVEPTQR